MASHLLANSSVHVFFDDQNLFWAIANREIGKGFRIDFAQPLLEATKWWVLSLFRGWRIKPNGNFVAMPELVGEPTPVGRFVDPELVDRLGELDIDVDYGHQQCALPKTIPAAIPLLVRQPNHPFLIADRHPSAILR